MKGHVLVVDDEKRLCAIFETFLTREDYRVESVHDYETAVRAIAANRYDVILTDIMLGKHSGLDLLRLVKENDDLTPVIIITGHPTIENASECVRLGAFDYLRKPVEKIHLLMTVNLALTHRKLMEKQRRLEDELVRQKRLYQSIVEDQTEFICRHSAGGTMTFVNKAYAAYLGKQPHELLGSPFLFAVSDLDREMVSAHMAGFRPGFEQDEIEYRVIMPDGETRWQRWVDRAIFDGQNLVEFQSVGKDITAQKAIQKALSDHQIKLEAVFQSIPEGVIAVDNEMGLIQKNTALAGICQRLAELPDEKRLVDDTAPCRSECLKILSHTLKTGQPVVEYQMECRPCEKDPSKNLILTSSPLVDSLGGVEGALLVFRDITKISELERKLAERDTCASIVGKSEKMRHVFNLVRLLADVDTTILITGESGTGKELVMESLHHSGFRSSNPLVRVNCSVFPENLLESELFGHVRGAFTGAVKDRVGRFEAADGGTVFLDEIGDISLNIQLKLLRFIESKEFERVGDNKIIKTDARIITATNRDLAERVRQGAFREDFYYRLKVMNIHVPPLRERTEDIPLLVNHFFEIFSKAFNKKFKGISDQVMDIFLNYGWPGNVRELKHVVEHACILCPGGTITKKYLMPDLLDDKTAPLFPPGDPQGPARGDIESALKQAGGNKAKAARILGISRSTIYRRISEFGIPDI